MGRGALTLALAALACAAGCDASLTMTRPREMGPVAEVGVIDPGAGQARYALNGPGWLVERRRRRAFHLVAKRCGGEKLYRITAERTQDVTETPFNEDDLTAEDLLTQRHYRLLSYRVMEFECLKP